MVETCFSFFFFPLFKSIVEKFDKNMQNHDFSFFGTKKKRRFFYGIAFSVEKKADALAIVCLIDSHIVINYNASTCRCFFSLSFSLSEICRLEMLISPLMNTTHDRICRRQERVMWNFIAFFFVISLSDIW